MPSFVTFSNVGKIYHTGELDITALHDVNFEIEKENFKLSSVHPVPENDDFKYIRRNGYLNQRTGIFRRQEISNYDKKQLTSYPAFRHRICVPVLQPRAEPDST